MLGHLSAKWQQLWKGSKRILLTLNINAILNGQLMDNFRRHRRHAPHANSTDGFVRPAHPRGEPGHVGLSRQNAYQPARRIGDFRSTDGFHPVTPRRPSSGLPAPGTEHTSKSLGQHDSAHIQRDLASSQPVKKKKLGRLRGFFSPSNWTKRRAAAALTVMVLLVGGFFGGKAWLKARQIFTGGGGAAALQEDVDPYRLKGEGDGRVNVLLLGRGGEGHAGADLTDTIVVASINPIQKEAALLSIPRDLYVQTSSGGYTKINSVFAYAKESALANSNPNDKNRVRAAEDAGFKAVEDIIQSKIGIPIHYYGIIDFAGFMKAIDTVGGVDVNVPDTGVVYENLWLFGQNYTLDVRKGQQHFNGLRALAYTRSRYTSTRGDFDRSERQRMIMVALKNKILSAGTYSNPLRVSRLMDDFGDHVRTNLSLDEVMRLYDIGSEIGSDKIASVGLADPPNDYLTTGMVNGLSVVMPKAGLDDYRQIQHFVRNRLIDGYLAKESAKVMVLNGTSIPGLATRTADELKSFGYKINKIADAPTRGYHTTMVIDLRNGEKKYTKRYLENRFGIVARGSIPDPKIKPGDADFVIILGQNEQARLAN